MPETAVSDFTEMDNAQVSGHHWKIMSDMAEAILKLEQTEKQIHNGHDLVTSAMSSSAIVLPTSTLNLT
jgi:hypothetical protein